MSSYENYDIKNRKEEIKETYNALRKHLMDLAKEKEFYPLDVHYALGCVYADSALRLGLDAEVLDEFLCEIKKMYMAYIDQLED